MFKRFFPSEYVPSIADINYKALQSRGIIGLIFDIDNTIEGYGATTASKEKAEFLKGLKEKGFKICLVSNNGEERVRLFAEGLSKAGLSLPSIHKAGKPKKSVVPRAAALMGVSPLETAFIGDQVFTDIWCGNRCKTYTILVKPVTKIDPCLVRLKRLPEDFVKARYVRYIKKQQNG